MGSAVPSAELLELAAGLLLLLRLLLPLQSKHLLLEHCIVCGCVSCIHPSVVLKGLNYNLGTQHSSTEGRAAAHTAAAQWVVQAGQPKTNPGVWQLPLWHVQTSCGDMR